MVVVHGQGIGWRIEASHISRASCPIIFAPFGCALVARHVGHFAGELAHRDVWNELVSHASFDLAPEMKCGIREVEIGWYVGEVDAGCVGAVSGFVGERDPGMYVARCSKRAQVKHAALHYCGVLAQVVVPLCVVSIGIVRGILQWRVGCREGINIGPVDETKDGGLPLALVQVPARAFCMRCVCRTTRAAVAV